MNKHGGYHGDKKLIDFSININPLGPSEKFIERLKKSLENIDKYPEIDGRTGKSHISNKLKVSSENIILGNGAIQLIYVFARSMNFENVSIVQPTFNEYERAFRLTGSNISYFKTDEDDFKVDMEELKIHLDENHVDCLMLCNPNNPTGVFYQSRFIEELIHILDEKNVFLFIDESFIDFLEEKSAIGLIKRYNIFILRSLTKFYAIPGLRLGFGISDKEIINRMKENIEPWSVNSLALNSIKDIINDDVYNHDTLNWLDRERKFLYKSLKQICYIDVYESHTNFYLCKLKNMKAHKLQDLLMDRGIYIRTCEDFVGLGGRYFRIAIKKREENKEIIKALNSLDKVGG